MKLKILLTTGIIVAIMLPALAQPGDPGQDPGAPVPMEGTEILLVAGGLWGVKKIIDGKKIKKDRIKSFGKSLT
jgi:hypothetical protein